jgi:hypothetical protein
MWHSENHAPVRCRTESENSEIWTKQIDVEVDLKDPLDKFGIAVNIDFNTKVYISSYVKPFESPKMLASATGYISS